MSKPPQRLPDIPPEFNLFEIPRKKPPIGESAPPPPPAPPSPPPGSHGVGAIHGGGHKPDPQLKYWEQKVKEHAAENLKLHQQLDAITKHRDQLLTVLSSQQQGGAVLEEAKVALEAEMVNARQLEQQLVHLQQRLQEFNGKLAEKDQETALARQQAAALEHQLTQSTAELARIRTDLDTQAAEHATMVADLRSQISEATEAADCAEAALRDQTARAREASGDLANLRLAHHDLQRQAEENRKTTAELGKRNADLEQRLTDRAGEIQHLRSELDRRGTSYVDEFALRGRLKEELRHEYNARLATEQEAAGALRRQNHEIQERLNEALKEVDAFKRRSIDFTSTEAALAKQIHATQAMADKAQTAYGREAARANRLENTLETLKQTKDELQQKLATERKELTKFKRRAESLEKRVSGRKRGAAADNADLGDAADIDLRVRDTVTALARATADLEAERRRLENAALQSRLPSLDASRIGQAFVNTFRTQLRPSADTLMDSIRGLLDSSLETGQKKLAQSALESALIIQSSLFEPNLKPEPDS